MKHRKNIKILDRNATARKALLRGLANNFVLHEKIKTTEAKAKVLRSVIERCITTAKKGDLAARRRLSSYLYTTGAVKKMMEEIGPRYKDRKGGYTRITKLDTNRKDAAKMALIEFV
ncbi:MAG: 50S ribosomal protein L17 [Patescibacteria group bacterium]|jgi:large subunit ribosomal protein L17